jgi:hypothetical protein
MHLGDVLLVLFLYFSTKGTNLRKAYNYIYILIRISDCLKTHLQPHLQWWRLEVANGPVEWMSDHAITPGFVSRNILLYQSTYLLGTYKMYRTVSRTKAAEDPLSNVDREQEQHLLHDRLTYLLSSLYS